MSYFSSINVTFPSESEKDINTWADYCELFCLLSEDKSQTIDQLRDRLIEQCDGELDKASKNLMLTGTATGNFIAELMAEEEEEILEEDELEEDAVAPRSRDSELNDKIQTEFRFLFDFLQSRQNLFSTKYPFEINGNKIALVRERNEHQDLYLALMLSAVLRIYRPGDRNRLGHLFEDLCGHIFKKLVPSESSIYAFGAGGNARASSPFTGTFFERVNQLGTLIHTSVTNEFIANKHDHEHLGDGGLDWVAWYNFTDNLSRKPLFFGQCACGSDWVDKEMDAHEDKWNNKLQFHDRYLLYHFISKCFRKSDGEWLKPGEINFGIILVDRLRVLDCIDSEKIRLAIPPYQELLDEALSINLSAVDI